MTPPDCAAPDLTGFDLRALPPGFHDNPYPWYAVLRSQSPVSSLPDGSVLLTRYRDCEAVYRDPKLFCSDKQAEFGAKFGNPSCGQVSGGAARTAWRRHRMTACRADSRMGCFTAGHQPLKGKADTDNLRQPANSAARQIYFLTLFERC